MSDEARAQVDSILTAAKVTFSATYLGERKFALGGDTVMDEWACAFKRLHFHGPATEAQTFAFFTGVGHRKRAKRWNSSGTRMELTKDARPAAPHAADVLHSILLDSSASAQSFESWCDDYGYDSDSRKALATYEACQRNADKLARILHRDTIELLREALQDY